MDFLKPVESVDHTDSEAPIDVALHAYGSIPNAFNSKHSVMNLIRCDNKVLNWHTCVVIEYMLHQTVCNDSSRTVFVTVYVPRTAALLHE